jgi:hypothetical protein
MDTIELRLLFVLGLLALGGTGDSRGSRSCPVWPSGLALGEDQPPARSRWH